jgi:RNase P subunit RPR2
LTSKQTRLYNYIKLTSGPSSEDRIQELLSSVKVKTEELDDDFGENIFVECEGFEGTDWDDPEMSKTKQAGTTFDDIFTSSSGSGKRSRVKFKDDEKSSTKKTMCQICGVSIGNFRRHVLKVHMNIKNFFCDLCSHAAYFKCDLEQHMKVHAQKPPKPAQSFFCESCGLTFPKRFHLNAHVKAKHTTKVRNHICGICGKGNDTFEVNS